MVVLDILHHKILGIDSEAFEQFMIAGIFIILLQEFKILNDK